MELMIRIYGFFKKMGPMILYTLTASQNLTLSSCEGTLWTAWVIPEHQYGILAVYIPIRYEPYLPKMKVGQALDKEVCWLSVF
jgi:hypothetical protein